ncbi:MAG: RNA polymerase sigma factor, partial [Muribaculaceae bacterium]|nr:RNA polymerase sigma factor [Muribaculaceae bacterium]
MTADEFKKRYLAYHKRLYQLAFVLTSDPQDAEDLLQDLYLKIWQIRDRIADISNHEAFMATVMRRIFYDKVRANGADGQSIPLAEAQNVTAATDISQQFDDQEELAQLEDFIGELPPKEQK